MNLNLLVLLTAIIGVGSGVLLGVIIGDTRILRRLFQRERASTNHVAGTEAPVETSQHHQTKTSRPADLSDEDVPTGDGHNQHGHQGQQPSLKYHMAKESSQQHERGDDSCPPSQESQAIEYLAQHHRLKYLLRIPRLTDYLTYKESKAIMCLWKNCNWFRAIIYFVIAAMTPNEKS
jgi:hypothetical protein